MRRRGPRFRDRQDVVVVVRGTSAFGNLILANPLRPAACASSWARRSRERVHEHHAAILEVAHVAGRERDAVERRRGSSYMFMPRGEPDFDDPAGDHRRRGRGATEVELAGTLDRAGALVGADPRQGRGRVDGAGASPSPASWERSCPAPTRSRSNRTSGAACRSRRPPMRRGPSAGRRPVSSVTRRASRHWCHRRRSSPPGSRLDSRVPSTVNGSRRRTGPGRGHGHRRRSRPPSRTPRGAAVLLLAFPATTARR